MSTVSDAIAQAMAAGIRAARIAPLVHCHPAQRDTIRWRLALADKAGARAFWRELETRWRFVDAGQPAWKDMGCTPPTTC